MIMPAYADVKDLKILGCEIRLYTYLSSDPNCPLKFEIHIYITNLFSLVLIFLYHLLIVSIYLFPYYFLVITKIYIYPS